MGWGGPMPNLEGRLVGYNVRAVCDHIGCITRIDRGIAYVCGGMHDGGEHGCGKYVCGQHLYFAPIQLCKECADNYQLICRICGEDGPDIVNRCCQECRNEKLCV